MAINVTCPKCGSTKVQLSDVSRKHGCLWFILFGWIYLFWIMIKWMIGFLVLILLDWWLKIIYTVRGKGYLWHCKKWFSGKTKYYYCHECGHNFKYA